MLKCTHSILPTERTFHAIINSDQRATQSHFNGVDSPAIANVIELFDIRSRVAGYASQAGVK
ncbi:MAG: hypothetical protein U0V70_14100 [Terriglobia bacterium]